MQITKVTVRGETGNFAEFTRKGATVEVEVIEPNGQAMLDAPVADRKRLWWLAESVQERLDGSRGTGSDVRDYFDLIERVADA